MLQPTRLTRCSGCQPRQEYCIWTRSRVLSCGVEAIVPLPFSFPSRPNQGAMWVRCHGGVGFSLPQPSSALASQPTGWPQPIIPSGRSWARERRLGPGDTPALLSSCCSARFRSKPFVHAAAYLAWASRSKQRPRVASCHLEGSRVAFDGLRWPRCCLRWRLLDILICS